MKKRSFEVEAERWEEMKREGKVDDCRLWLPLEVEGERTLALYGGDFVTKSLSATTT